uniref:COX assembly mitochondrial protein n=1 Tax=Meloidogyne hapla TaxID=6305 RepID=A0A1I8BFU8_MELHA
MHQQNVKSETKHPYIINTLNDSHDSLRKRKEGEIVYDERRKKWYRVKKTIYPTHVTVGPLNLDIIAKRIEKNECRETFMKFAECIRVEGPLTGTHNCKPFYKEFQDCKVEKFRDQQLRKEVTDEFLKERTEYRKTGQNQNFREFERYLKWREEQLLKEKQKQEKN